jgi:hypothetical protein
METLATDMCFNRSMIFLKHYEQNKNGRDYSFDYARLKPEYSDFLKA